MSISSSSVDRRPAARVDRAQPPSRTRASPIRRRASGAYHASTNARRSGSSVACARSTAGALSAALILSNALDGRGRKPIARPARRLHDVPVDDLGDEPPREGRAGVEELAAVEHLLDRPRRHRVPDDLERRGGKRHAEPDLVQAEAPGGRAHHARVARQGQDAAAGHRVASQCGHHRARIGEDAEHDRVEPGHELVHGVPLEPVERHEVEPGREEAIVAGQDESARVPGPRLVERALDRGQGPGVQRVGLPAGEMDDGEAVSPLEVVRRVAARARSAIPPPRQRCLADARPASRRLRPSARSSSEAA